MNYPQQPYGSPPNSSPVTGQDHESYGNYSYPAPGTPNLVPAPQPTRKTENFILNTLLYVAALFVVGSAALFITSVAYPLVRVVLMLLGTLAFYGSGLATYKWVPKLRLASYSFAATGVALIPLTGLATYTMLWRNGPAVWAITSLLGTGLVLLGAAIMQERIMAYLIITFLVSDVLASSKVLQLSLIWYFAGLLVLATALGICNRFSLKTVPQKLQRGFLDSSRIFVPLTMVAALYCWSRFSHFELAVLFALATGYCLAFMQRPLAISLYVQSRIYSALAILFLVTNVAIGSYWVFLPALALGGVLLLSSIAIICFVRQGALPWNVSYDALFTWGISLFISAIGFASLAGQNSRYSASSDFFLNFSWVLPRDDAGHFLLPAWILPLVFVASTLLFLRKTSPTVFYSMLGASTGLSSLLLWNQSGCIVLISGGLTLFAAAKNAGRRESVNRLLGTFFMVVGALVALVQTLSVTPAYIYLGLALALAVLSLVMALTQVRRVGLGKELPSYVHDSVLTWSALGIVGLLLLAFSTTSQPIFRGLSRFEFTVQSSIITLLLTIIAVSVAAVPVVLLKQPISTSLSSQLLTAYAIWTILTSVAFTAVANTSAGLLFLIPHLALAIIGWVSYQKPFAGVFSISARLIFCYAALYLILALDEISPWDVVATLLVLATLSVVSLVLHRKQNSSLEKICGLGTLILAHLYLAVAVFYALPHQGLLFVGILLGLIVMALSTAWLCLVFTQANRVIFSLLLPSSLAFTATFIVTELNFKNHTVFEVFTWVLFAGLIICKALALLTPFSDSSRVVPVHGTSGKLDNRRFASLVLPGLVTFSVYFFFSNWWLNDISAALLILGIFGLYALQARLTARVTLAIIGLVLASIRVLFGFDDVPVFFLIFEVAVSILAIISISKSFNVSNRPSRALHWWGFGLQIWTSLLVVLGFDQPVFKRIVLLFVTVLLLAAVALGKNKAATIATAILITAQVFWTSFGFTPITLFFFGIALLALVIWRLLARKDDEPSPAIPGDSTGLPFIPPSKAPVTGQNVAHDVPGSTEIQGNKPQQQGSASPQYPSRNFAQPPRTAPRNPWDPPEGEIIKPWSSNQ